MGFESIMVNICYLFPISTIARTLIGTFLVTHIKLLKLIKNQCAIS